MMRAIVSCLKDYFEDVRLQGSVTPGIIISWVDGGCCVSIPEVVVA
jgi:hypothetical protein